MDFAGNAYIYLSKLKREKIKKIKKAEENNKGEAPTINQKSMQKDSLDSEDSDDSYLAVDSNDFNIDLEKPNTKPIFNLMNSNLNAAPGVTFKKAIDTNVCVIRYNTLEKEPDNTVLELYKCQKCNAYLNKYSVLTPLTEKDKYSWKCEFCSNLNMNIYIENNNYPKNDCVEKCINEPQTVKEGNREDDDYSLIFCLDTSSSMSESYYIDGPLREKFNKIRGGTIGNMITRLDMVKISIENIINSLLKKSPKVKAGLVTFGRNVEVKGDCLSNIIVVKTNDLDNESKLVSLGKENTNLIKSEISQSSIQLIKTLREIKDEGCTPLGPGVLLSLSLLNKAKVGSRIFLCTDGASNEGVGAIWNDGEMAREFYSKVGNIAKEKGVVISLIAFEDCDSQINILKNMVENSGGDIFRVNPEYILDDINDFLENKAIASEVEIKMNLNKCMTFRDEEKKHMINDGSTIVKQIGNVTKEKETYFELKFKNAKKLAEIKETNFDELNYLIFQSEIIYKKKNEGKYSRIITKKLKVSDNKEEIQKQANLNIVSTLQIQKSAKLAGEGKIMDAQAQIHIARNYLNNNINYQNNK